MKAFIFAAFLGLVAVVQSQSQSQSQLRQSTTPVPILKSLNKVNEDGSYTYGYENGDGSYKIETKDKDGQVHGKYGYYDADGQLREIEYGAKSGFHPTGTGVKAPEAAPPLAFDGLNDGSYDPEIYTYPFQQGYTGPNQPNQVQGAAPRKVVRVKTGRRQNAAARQLFQQQQPQYQQEQVQAAPQQQQYQAQPQYQQPQQQQPQYYPQPQQNYYQQQPQAPAFNPAQLFAGHPARNIDLNTGSYSVNYSG